MLLVLCNVLGSLFCTLPRFLLVLSVVRMVVVVMMVVVGGLDGHMLWLVMVDL